MPTVQPSLEEIRKTVSLFLQPGSVIELRAPKTEREGVISGYFDDPEKLARAAFSLAGRAPGLYLTLNPVLPALLSRAIKNQVKTRAPWGTGDAEITCRRMLLLDFDAQRPQGISSTDEEHEAAINIALLARDQLREAGWPDPVVADSGNGAHLVYRIDLPNDAEATALVKSVLKAAEARWNTRSIKVDQTVFNASRISKIYGTIAAKGVSTEERPHRLSRILEMPDALQVVSAGQLAALGAEVKLDPPRPPAPSGPRPHSALPPFDLEGFISRHGIRIHRGPVDDHGSEKWVLEECPFNPSHKHPDSAIFRQPSGRLGFKCLHNSCADKDWPALRELFDGPRPVRTGPRAVPSRAPDPPADDRRDEIPVGAADVEAAADAAIAADDVVMAMRLAPDLAVQRTMTRVVVIAKLKAHFKRRFSSRDFEAAMKDAAAPPPPPPDDEDESDEPFDDGPNLLLFPFTDSGNGERIVAMFGKEVHYCNEMRRWLIWDGVRWAVDDCKAMRQKAKQMARLLYRQAKDKGESGFQNHARASESAAAITSALLCAESEPGIPISAAELDQHPYLLNVTNGVIDLRTGQLLKHNREFLITKLCPVPYQPAALCPRFISFIEWAMGANPEAEVTPRTARMVAFLQRAFGYSLTGDVSEKAIFIFHGEQGNNGKTTLLTVFRTLLGRDYSGQLVIDTVMSMKNTDATARADLADLRGVRLVVTSEVEKEHRLSEGKIKYITAGMGSIKSCRKYENPIEFEATHKLFMDANYRPTVRGVDDAIWRRLKLVPFEVSVSDEEKDLQLSAKLRAEFPGILAWAVRGCIEWAKSGLGDPPEVSQANLEWREHDDPLKEFLDDCCDLGPDCFVGVTEMYMSYAWWSKQNGEKYPLGREAFKERLEAKKLFQARKRIDGVLTRIWRGLELRGEVAQQVRKSPPKIYDME